MKHVLLAVSAIAIVAIALVMLAREPAVEEALIGAAIWMRDAGALGLVLFAAAYVMATIALAPAVALNFPTGVAFGFLWGGLISISVSVAAATLAFLLGRSVLRKPLERRFRGYHRLAAIDRAVGARGFLVVLLLRLTSRCRSRPPTTCWRPPACAPVTSCSARRSACCRSPCCSSTSAPRPPMPSP
jgi:uncharacterized membrane protein YdjX (TVP38/TMEM64 family)